MTDPNVEPNGDAPVGRRTRGNGLKVATAAVAAAVVLATGGVAHAGYRWGRTTDTRPARSTTSVVPATTTTTEAPVTAKGYRWG